MIEKLLKRYRETRDQDRAADEAVRKTMAAIRQGSIKRQLIEENAKAFDRETLREMSKRLIRIEQRFEAEDREKQAKRQVHPKPPVISLEAAQEKAFEELDVVP